MVYLLKQRLSIFYYWPILLTTYAPAQATTVNISVGGSEQTVTAVTGQTIQFDVSVICSGDLDYIDGTGQPKGNKSKSEVEWSFINNSSATIRLTGFGITWNCLSGDCNGWFFDYLKFDSPVEGAKKIYDNKSPVTPPFSVTDFDSDVGNSNEHKNPYLDIPDGSSVGINEIEFVDSKGKKIDKISSGTKLELFVTWRDTNGNTYPQNFTVTWP